MYTQNIIALKMNFIEMHDCLNKINSLKDIEIPFTELMLL